MIKSKKGRKVKLLLPKSEQQLAQQYLFQISCYQQAEMEQEITKDSGYLNVLRPSYVTLEPIQQKTYKTVQVRQNNTIKRHKNPPSSTKNNEIIYNVLNSTNVFVGKQGLQNNIKSLMKHKGNSTVSIKPNQNKIQRTYTTPKQFQIRLTTKPKVKSVLSTQKNDMNSSFNSLRLRISNQARNAR